MTDKELLDMAARAVAAARSAGADQAEAYLEYSRTFTGRVREGQTALVKQATRRGLGLRVIAGGKTGFVNSSDLRPESLDRLAALAVNLAKAGEKDDLAGLPTEAGTPLDAAALKLHDPELLTMTTEKKLDLAREAEAACRAADKRVTKVEGTQFSSSVSTVSIVNSLGRSLQYQGTGANLGTTAYCDQGDGKSQSAGYFTAKRFLKDLKSPEFVGKEAARTAVEKLNPVKLPSRKVPVLMHPDVAGGWLQNMVGAFAGDQVFKKASFLTDKLGQTVGAPLVSIVDDGTLLSGVATVPFDGEGVATRRNVLLDKGVVAAFLYDTYNAKKAGKVSTGSANRGYDSVPNIGTRNLYFTNGDTSLADLMKIYDEFFYMTDNGAFGFTPSTGDYSYQAAGLWVEKGVVKHAVDQITVASNSLQMLKNIVKVGNDLEFEGGVNAPHLLISEMSISGT